MRWPAVCFGTLMGALSLVLGACGGGTGGGGVSVGTAAVEFELRLATTEPNGTPTSAGPLQLPGTVEVTSAVLNVDRIRLTLPPSVDCVQYFLAVSEAEAGAAGDDVRLGDGCNEALGELRFDGDFRFDLISGDVTPPLGRLLLPAGGYREIRLKIDAIEDPENPLADATLAFSGRLADGTPFAVISEADDELRFAVEDDVAIELREGAQEQLLVEVDRDGLFADVSSQLEACAQSMTAPFVDGELRLDERGGMDLDLPDVCEEIEDLLENNLEGAGRLRRD